MLPLPKLFEASKPIQPQGLKIQVLPDGDVLVNQIISGAGISGIVGTTAYIQAAAPELITVFWTEKVATLATVHSQTTGYAAGSVTKLISSSTSYTTITKSATVAVTKSSTAALAAAATPVAIALVVIALAIIADKRAQAKKEKNLAKQRDQIDKLNKQNEELSRQEQELRNKLEKHIEKQEKLLGNNVINHRNQVAIYRVKDGDILGTIAQNHNISLDELLDANPRFNKNLLYNQNFDGVLNNKVYLGQSPHTIKAGEYIKIPATKTFGSVSAAAPQLLPILPPLDPPTNQNTINLKSAEVLTKEARYNRILKIINNNPNWYNIVDTSEENRLIELIQYAQQDNARAFLDLLNDGSTLQFLQSSIQNDWYQDDGNYNELHKTIYNVWIESASQTQEFGDHQIKVLSFNETKTADSSLKEYLNHNVVPWSNPGLIKSFTQTPWVNQMNASLTKEGKIALNVTREHYLADFRTGEEIKFEINNPLKIDQALKLFDPWEPVTIEFQTTSKKYPNQLKGSQITIPAYSLLLLENEQIWDDFHEAVNIATTVMAFTNPFSTALWAIRLEQALTTIAMVRGV